MMTHSLDTSSQDISVIEPKPRMSRETNSLDASSQDYISNEIWA